MKEPNSLDQLLDQVVAHTECLRLWEELGCEDGVHIFQMLDDVNFVIKGTAEKTDDGWYVIVDNGTGEQAISGSGEKLVSQVALVAAGMIESDESN